MIVLLFYYLEGSCEDVYISMLPFPYNKILFLNKRCLDL